MRMTLSAAIAALLLAAGGAGAQDSRDDLPGLDDDGKVEEFHIDVRVKVTDLVEDVGALEVLCILSMPVGTMTQIVGYGRANFYRNELPERPFTRTNEHFIESTFDKTIAVPIYAYSETVSAEYWQTGECSLAVGVGVRDMANFGVDAKMWHPSDCTRSTDEESFGHHCVWPGTDPEAARFTFSRPGLADSAVVDAE